ncbi:alpha/beta hydrolase [Roseomonas sp. OT10]|uniref:alpha/beta fold hydrolase n=1 Tax=Roseomonas cutis TaxID=2897332 RepID=UPI001E452724|nr:alpha/beta hydrolase [Roseomonas sp. OT10]UFN48176.1 alpha/beta hydrolase [Roseomonas sp. OT10]
MPGAPITPLRAAGLTGLRRDGGGGALPLVLLHGIGSNARSWERLLDLLDPHATAIAWDAPGYGGSDALAPAAPGPADYAEALERLLDALGLDRVRLVGHSLGCLFAARFAATRADRVATLALLSPALGYGVPPGMPLPAAVQGRIDELERMGPVAFAAARAARLVYRPEEKPEVLAAVRAAMGAVRPDGYAQAVRALGAGDLLADAARIEAPTAVAVGLEDVVTPPANAHRLHDALRHAGALLEVPGAGHALPQERPEAVAALLTETEHG